MIKTLTPADLPELETQLESLPVFKRRLVLREVNKVVTALIEPSTSQSSAAPPYSTQGSEVHGSGVSAAGAGVSGASWTSSPSRSDHHDNDSLEKLDDALPATHEQVVSGSGSGAGVQDTRQLAAQRDPQYDDFLRWCATVGSSPSAIGSSPQAHPPERPASPLPGSPQPTDEVPFSKPQAAADISASPVYPGMDSHLPGSSLRTRSPPVTRTAMQAELSSPSPGGLISFPVVGSPEASKASASFKLTKNVEWPTWSQTYVHKQENLNLDDPETNPAAYMKAVMRVVAQLWGEVPDWQQVTISFKQHIKVGTQERMRLDLLEESHEYKQLELTGRHAECFSTMSKLFLSRYNDPMLADLRVTLVRNKFKDFLEVQYDYT